MPWIALVVLGAKCPKAWSATPVHSQLDLGKDTIYEAYDEAFKAPVFTSTMSTFPLGLRAHGFPQLKGLHIVALVVAVSAVIFLVSTCIRLMHTSAPSGGAAFRSLAVGGEDASCTGMEDDGIDAKAHERAVLAAGQEQLRLLQPQEQDAATLTPEEKAIVLDAKQRLVHATMVVKDRATAVAKQRTIVEDISCEIQAQEDASRKGILRSGTPDARSAFRQQSALLGVAVGLYREARMTLEAMSWSPNQDVNTLIQLADAYMERNLTPPAAAALAAAEQVRFMGQTPARIVTPFQIAKINQVVSAAMIKVNEKRKELDILERPQLPVVISGSLLTAQTALLIRQLRYTGLYEQAAELENALSGLKASVARHSKFPLAPTVGDNGSQAPQLPPKSHSPSKKSFLPPFKGEQRPDVQGESPSKRLSRIPEPPTTPPKDEASRRSPPPLPQKLHRSPSASQSSMSLDVKHELQAPPLPPKSRTSRSPLVSPSSEIAGSLPLQPIQESSLPNILISSQSIILSWPLKASQPASSQIGATPFPGTEQQPSGDAAQPQSSQVPSETGVLSLHAQGQQLQLLIEAARDVTSGLMIMQATLQEALSGEEIPVPLLEALISQAIPVVERAGSVNMPPSLPKKVVTDLWMAVLMTESMIKKAAEGLSPQWQANVSLQQQSILQATKALQEARTKATVPPSETLLRSIILCKHELLKAKAFCAMLEPSTLYGPSSLAEAVFRFKGKIFEELRIVNEEANKFARGWQSFINQRLSVESGEKDAGSSAGVEIPLTNILGEASRVTSQLELVLGSTGEIARLRQALQRLKEFVESKTQKPQ